MAPILYKKDMSPPSRAVLLTAKALELELILNDVDLCNREHLEEEFLKLNPQHTVPVLVDDGFVLVDSHAIITYLVGKYGPDDSLYPNDLQQRASIDHKLFFDAGTLQPIMQQILFPILYEGEKSISEKNMAKLNEAYSFLEAFLKDKDWLAGDSATVADLAVMASVTSLNVMVPIDAELYPKLGEWMGRIEELPYYEANAVGLEQFKNFAANFMGGESE